ncbi:hypothetical protein GEMRC1_011995 [Eukaryota sp. GEM-RC1]
MTLPKILLQFTLSSVTIKASADLPLVEGPLVVRVLQLQPSLLRITITRDPQVDPTFFYFCDLDSPSFSLLKDDQRLEYEFADLVDKLKFLLADSQDQQSPRFAQLNFDSPSACRFASMCRTSFVSYVELSLNLTRGTDSDLIDFLAGRLAFTTKEVESLKNELLELQLELKSRSNRFDLKLSSFKEEISSLQLTYDTYRQQSSNELSEKKVSLVTFNHRCLG